MVHRLFFYRKGICMKSYLISDVSSFAFKEGEKKVFVQGGLGLHGVCSLRDCNWFLAVETEQEPVFIRAKLSLGSKDSRRMEVRLHTRMDALRREEAEASRDLYGPVLEAFDRRLEAEYPVLDCAIQERRGKFHVRELADIWDDVPMLVSSENVFRKEKTEYRIANPIRSKQHKYRDTLRPGEESREAFQSWRRHLLGQFSAALQMAGGEPLSSSEEEKAFALCVNYAERRELFFKREKVSPAILKLGESQLSFDGKAVIGNTDGGFSVMLKDRRPEKMRELCEKLHI